MQRFLPIALVLGIILGPFIVGCAVIGTGLRAKAAQIEGVVAPERLGDPKAVSSDSFVTTTASFALVARDRFPLADSTDAVENGASIYAMQDAPNVIVYCLTADCAPLAMAGRAPVKVEARICSSATTFFGCRPTSALGDYVTAQAKARRVPKDQLRVLLVGDLPSSQRAESWLAYGFSSSLLLLYGGLVVYVGLRKRTSAPLFLEMVHHVQHDPPTLRARIEEVMRGHDEFRVVHEVPGGFTFVQGVAETRARLNGLTTAADVPRRTTVSWTSRPYHPTMLRVKIEDQVDWLGDVNTTLRPLLESALVRTRDQMEQAL